MIVPISLREIITLDTGSLFMVTGKILKEYFGSVFRKHEDYLYAPGSIPICLVAHLDTFARYDGSMRLVADGNAWRNENGILGADDRAGVFAVLNLLGSCKRNGGGLPCVLFTNYEETGCAGAKSFIGDNVFGENVNLFIEIDRQGASEYVHYNRHLPPAVSEYVESFGYVQARGSRSDVFYLTERYGIPSVNVSAGYYKQHSREERLHVDELFRTIDRVGSMLEAPIRQCCGIFQ